MNHPPGVTAWKVPLVDMYSLAFGLITACRNRRDYMSLDLTVGRLLSGGYGRWPGVSTPYLLHQRWAVLKTAKIRTVDT